MVISRRKLLLGAGAGIAVAGGGAALAPMLLREGTLSSSQSRALHVEGEKAALPSAADVVIIGGGIVGICSAMFLSERGMKVVVCEKGAVAGEQSGRAYSQIISYEMMPEVLPLALRGKELWRGMNERIGADTSYRMQGRVQTYTSEEGLEQARAWLEAAREKIGDTVDFPTRFIEGEELRRRIPDARTDWKIGGFEEDSGSVDPETGVPMIARYLQSQGIPIHTNCAVRGIETEGGRVSGVVTEKGAIRAPVVVLASGVWSRLFLGNMGVNLPVLQVYLSQQRLSRPEGSPPRGNGHIGNTVYYREQADGTYANAPRIITASIVRDNFELLGSFLPAMFDTKGLNLPIYLALNKDFVRSLQTPRHWTMDEVTPFEQMRIAEPTPSTEHLDYALKNLRNEFPVFSTSQVIERWGGCINLAADHVPIISTVDAYPGLVHATGFSFGMTQGPAAAELIADMVTGATPRMDPAPFRLSRL